MAEIVNLRLIRKRKRRAAAAQSAAAKREVHGRNRGAKAAQESVSALDAKRLDGHRRTRRESKGDEGGG